jgi:acyl-CoA thioesterase
MTSAEGSEAGAEAAAVLHAHAAAARLGVRLDRAGDDGVTVSLTVGDDHVNGYGICHGGVLFTLGELACLGAAGPTATAIGSTIELLSSAPLGAALTASSRRSAQRGRTAVWDVSVCRDDGTVVVLMRCRTRLVADPGPPGG